MNISLVDLRETIPDIILDIKYAGEDNFIAAKVEGYNAAKALLMENAAQALNEVQQRAKQQGLCLKVFDAYRPQRAVDHFIRWSQDESDQRNKSLYYPNIDKKNLFEAGYLVKQSSHSRGSTLDLTLVKREHDRARELDMGTPFDFFDELSWCMAEKLNHNARQNRQLLRELMTQQGFVPFASEWWHFTFGAELYPNTYFDFPIN